MVEWKKLGDLCTIRTGKLNANQQVENGDYPFFTCDATPFKIDKYAFDTEALLLSGNGSQVGHLNYYKGKFNAYQRTYVLDRFSGIDIFFLYHYMKGTIRQYVMDKSKKGSVPYITLPMLQDFRVPVPFLSEQNRIVGILDTFTASIENLKEQIAQRRKQYEYYRDQLLDLEGKEEKSIGELFVFKNGLNKEKKFFGQGNPIVNYTDVYHNNKLFSETLKGRVTLDKDEVDRFRVQRGDVFFTRTSETPEEIGYAAVLLDNIDNCTFSGFLLRARPTTNLLLPEYCGYCFSSYKVRKTIIKLSTYTTRALTNGTSLSKISIPVPSLEEQSRIVSILDTFEASIQNLEAQLAQRDKQYEYYRNKLLTFE
jgi:Restriction endonuclease S subunits